MVRQQDIIGAFVKLSEVFVNLDTKEEHKDLNIREAIAKFSELVRNVKMTNPWFTEDYTKYALKSIGQSIQQRKIEKWLEMYPEGVYTTKPKRVAVVMAGNIPLVGFADFIAVLISGNIFVGKLSSQDKVLFRLMVDVLLQFCPKLSDRIVLSDSRLPAFDAVIATGSDNSARYFDYYFGKYPNIIRHNRNSVAVLHGDESREELEGIAKDVLMHYGLGCRNVSYLYVPCDYDFTPLYQVFDTYDELKEHTKYFNNYEYYRSVYLIDQEEHLDNGFVILKESNSYASPISVVHYRHYFSVQEVKDEIALNADRIQCVVSTIADFDDALKPGEAQSPELWDYADGVDTIRFLSELS